jgi:uncharacterized RDD family membrane protein YckC
VLGLFMSYSVGYYFAGRAVVMLKIGHPESIWKGVIPFFMGMAGPFTYVLPLAFYLIFLSEALFDTSPGKLVFRIRICTIRGESLSGRERWLRHVIKTAPLWLMLLALLMGRWELAIISIITLIILLLGILMVFNSKKQSLHDRLAGTKVVKL